MKTIASTYLLLAFGCSYAFAQSSTHSDSPPDQHHEQGNRASTTKDVRDNGVYPATARSVTESSQVTHEQSLRNEQQNDGNQNGDNGNKSEEDRIRLVDWLNIVPAGIMAIFTVLLYVVTRRQALLMVNQNKAMEKQTELMTTQTQLMDGQTKVLQLQTELMENQNRLIKYSERAFVFVKGHKWISHLNPVTGEIIWEVITEWENVGNTPAIKMRFNTALEIRSDPLPDKFKFGEPPNFGYATLGPSGMKLTNVSITGSDLQEAMVGAKHVYMWGWVRYEALDDPDPHITKFCVKILASGNPKKAWVDKDDANNLFLAFPSQDQHNEAN